jgi:hypothetical protein
LTPRPAADNDQFRFDACWGLPRFACYCRFPRSAAIRPARQKKIDAVSVADVRGASFQAVEELRTHIDAFINDYNETARPFAWTKSKVHQKHLKPCFTD